MNLMAKFACVLLAAAVAMSLNPATALATSSASSSASKTYRAASISLAKTPKKPTVPMLGKWKLIDNGARHNPPATGVSYKVSWKKAKGAKGYQVRLYVKLGKKWQLQEQYQNGKHCKQYTQLKRSYTWTNSQWCDGIGVKVRAYRVVSGGKVYSGWTTLRKVTWR